MAIDSTIPAEAARPSTKRKAVNTSTDWTNTMPSDAAMYNAMPPINGARRPKASEIDPMSNCPRASPARVAVIVS